MQKDRTAHKRKLGFYNNYKGKKAVRVEKEAASARVRGTALPPPN